MEIYDYIYVDLDKVISVYSQMTGGVVEVLERNAERSRSEDNKRNYDFRVFKHDAGGSEFSKEASKQVIKPHHDLLKEMEEALASKGFLVDLTDDGDSSFCSAGFRDKLKRSFCIKVKGRVVIEDYERIKSIGAAFPDVAKMINKSVESGVQKSDEYLELQAQIEEARNQIKMLKGRNERAAQELALEQCKERLRVIAASSTRVGEVEGWILDGMKTWIDTFLYGIINLRVYPNTDRPEEHVFGHLKKSCFVDRDANSFHFTYGSFPTEEFTLLGIVSSVPADGGEVFKPLAEFEKSELNEHESVEQGFRGLFRGFDGLEQMIRTCRFPRVLVYPLTVYRSVISSN
ncbi:DUF6414 family protein [Lysobacter sp. 22409]|uniref:DUF6414 family protein n=1 Tax=Lysobacter sp. 22409 TaxID=3453917 RepID=UPI003F83FC81